MYREHFGFQSPPFEDRLAQDAELFIGLKQRVALANLKIALGTRDAAVVLTGAAGVGKTALGSHSLRTTTTRLALAWIGIAPLTGHELLEQLLTEFGFNPYKCSRVERLQTWRQFLSEMSLTETRVGILLEKTDGIGADVLQTLESLTSATPNGCPGANVILTGGPELRNVLRASGLESLRQRVRLSQALDVLSADELNAFLAYKIGAAGGDACALFAPGAIAALHHFSEGRIRVVKNLCETALTIAAVRKETQLSPQLIIQVAVGLFGMDPPRTTTAVNAPPQDASAAVDESDTGAADESRSDMDRDLDVPTLTDSVEIAADPLLQDVAISEQAPSERGSTAAHDVAGSDGTEPGSFDEDDELAVDEELADPQQDALQAFANARALEDISNSMAETLFGDAELAQLGATLAVASGRDTATDAVEQRQADAAASNNNVEPRAISAGGGTAPRLA